MTKILRDTNFRSMVSTNTESQSISTSKQLSMVRSGQTRYVTRGPGGPGGPGDRDGAARAMRCSPAPDVAGRFNVGARSRAGAIARDRNI